MYGTRLWSKAMKNRASKYQKLSKQSMKNLVSKKFERKYKIFSILKFS